MSCLLIGCCPQHQDWTLDKRRIFGLINRGSQAHHLQITISQKASKMEKKGQSRVIVGPGVLEIRLQHSHPSSIHQLMDHEHVVALRCCFLLRIISSGESHHSYKDLNNTESSLLTASLITGLTIWNLSTLSNRPGWCRCSNVIWHPVPSR